MLKRTIIAAALLFFVTGGASGAQSDPPSDAPQRQATGQPSAAEPKYAPPPPTIIYVQPPQKTESETEQERHERSEKAELDRRLVELTAELALFTRWLAYATLALFIATAGMAVFAYFQSRDMKVSISETKRAADIAEDSLVKLQRAFVSVQQIKHISHLDMTNGKIWWTLHIIWENSGASPTRNLRFLVSPYLEGTDIPEDFQFLVPNIQRPVTFLGPRATTASEIAITGDDLAAVQSGTKFLYIWGRADYRDIFENTTEHVTKFFYRVALRGDATKAWDQTLNIVELIYAGQPRHNCADEDCNQEAT